jgi:hypothetical protein
VSLTVADASGTSAVSVPIEVATGGARPASLQFDLEFPSDALVVQAVDAGTAALAADKEVEFSAPQAGVLRVVISGMNDKEVSGQVAVARFVRAAGAASGTVALRAVRIVAASPESESLPVRSDVAHVTLQ